MPIYEYVCDDCQTHFEKIVFSSTNGSSNGASAKSSTGFSGGGGCCGGGCGCN